MTYHVIHIEMSVISRPSASLSSDQLRERVGRGQTVTDQLEVEKGDSANSSIILLERH